MTKGTAGAHGIQGIGANFVPKTLDKALLDEVLVANEEDSYAFARALAKKEGVLVGISSGAALSAAAYVSKLDKFCDKNIVVILPDSGERYLSTPLFD